ncbi:MAG: radical SAM protein, partial [Myxococcota bacterium]
GTVTIAGGRHASTFPELCTESFDAVVVGEPERAVPALIADWAQGELGSVYERPVQTPAEIRPARYDLIDFSANTFRLPALEATRGCPFSCGFCVLTGKEKWRYRPVAEVVAEIRDRLHWNRNLFGLMSDTFVFLDNNLGGSPKYLRELCEALVPLRREWGCAVSYNVIQDPELVECMARAGCRYVYTGLESLSQDALDDMHKPQNKLEEMGEVLARCYRHGIVVSSGMLVGSDADTNDYLERLPDLLHDLDFHAVTFVGIVTPFPGTPWFSRLAQDDRLLPNLGIRDLDGYTLCHRPARLEPSEVVEHFKNLSRALSSGPRVLSATFRKMGLNPLLGYRSVLTVTGKTVRNLRAALVNPERTYIAGHDPIEASDQEYMEHFGLQPQWIDRTLFGPERRPSLPLAAG